MTQRVIVKSSDESKTSSTLSADSELVVPLTTGTFRVRGLVRWTASGTADFKIGVQVTGSTLLRACGKISSDALSSVVTRPIGVLDASNIVSANARFLPGGAGYPTATSYAWIDIVVWVTGTGSLSVLWAQNTTTPSEAAIVKAGSVLTYEDLSELDYLTLVYRTTGGTQLTANTDPVDEDTLSIALEPDTAYAVEACISHAGAGTFGRSLTSQFVLSTDPVRANIMYEACQCDSIGSFSTSTTFFPMMFEDNVYEGGSPNTVTMGGGVTSTNNRSVAHFTGHVFTGSSGGNIKIKIGRTGSNPGGSLGLIAGSWIAAEKLPPCSIY